MSVLSSVAQAGLSLKPIRCHSERRPEPVEGQCEESELPQAHPSYTDIRQVADT